MNAAIQGSSDILLLALSTPDYPATPGDTYVLSYYSTTIQEEVETPLILDANYRLRVQNLGTINGRGKSYLQLKTEVEDLVVRNYPLSGAAMVLSRPGVFSVMVSGETVTAGYRNANGLTRISALTGGKTPNASIRFIEVTSADGRKRTYDTFQAVRNGDMAQDPYIRPGDKLYIPPAGRIVTLSGQVSRPGTYELLPNEQFQRLAEYYGGGFTPSADTIRIRLSRITTPNQIAGESAVFSYETALSMNLLDRDTVLIESREISRPTVFFEGALSVANSGNLDVTTPDIGGTVKMEYRFYEGETLGTAVRSIRTRFDSSSNLEEAYVVRDGTTIPVNLRKFLYFNDFTDDMALVNGDSIVIPYYRHFIIVSGAVRAPGRYLYVPDKTADYYINLAGGRDLLQNNGKGVQITDLNDKPLKDYELIPPESKITVPTNKFTFNFNQYAPILTTVLSIISTALSILITILTTTAF